MWKNFWGLFESLTTANYRLNRLEKNVEAIEKENRDQNKEIQSLWLQFERLAEREKWRDEMLRQKNEMERAKQEAEHFKSENERLKAELDSRLLLPPSTDQKNDQPEQ